MNLPIPVFASGGITESASKDLVRSEIATKHTNCTATENLSSIRCSILSSPRSIHLQEANLPSEMFALLGVVHVTHLIRHVFEPVLNGFNTRDHPCKLVSNHSLLEERLAEHFTLVRPPER